MGYHRKCTRCGFLKDMAAFGTGSRGKTVCAQCTAKLRKGLKVEYRTYAGPKDDPTPVRLDEESEALLASIRARAQGLEGDSR